MAYTAIDKSSDYFDIKLYSGNGSTQTIAGLDLQPDWTWIKNRNAGEHHVLTDAVRGANKQLNTNRVNVQGTLTTQLTAFTSDGFSVGAGSEVNNGSQTYVSWNWKANGAGSTNEDGSINTIKTSASTASGFSISTFTGTGSNATVGHGLGVAPKMVIIKSMTAGEDWTIFHDAIGATKYLVLNSSGGVGGPAAGPFNNTAPTSDVFSVGTWGSTNGSSQTLVAYSFAEVKGFSKIGSYLGNGEASNNTFIYCGFKPKYILHKAIIAENWILWDSTRNAAVNSNGNPTHVIFEPNGAGGENNNAARSIDLLSNGFKIRGNNANFGGSGTEYVFLAFAEEPLVSTNGVPATAR